MPEITSAPLIAAVMVTFNPTSSVIDGIEAIVEQVSEMVIVDNGSIISAINDIKVFAQERRNITFISLDDNFGIAYALNVGCQFLLEKNYSWCVLFDQDSKPCVGMVDELYNTWSKFPSNESVAVVGPRIVDINDMASSQKYLQLHRFLFFSRIAICKDRNDIAVVITSGSLINLDVFIRHGMFVEELFIDYVDTEYCLRLLLNGFRIGVSYNAVLYHSLGNKEVCSVAGLKITPTNHAVLRRYYIARNSVFMMKRYGFKYPSWLCFDLLSSMYNFFRIAIFERNRLAKACYSLKGFFHGVLGITGRHLD